MISWLYPLIFMVNVSQVIDIQSLEPILKSTDTTCVGMEFIDQDYFPEVSFVNIYAKCTEWPTTIPIWKENYVQRVAIDNEDRIFRLFNVDTIEFNDLAEAHPLVLPSDSIYEYGKFFLETARLDNVYPYFYLTDIIDLRMLNKENLFTWLLTDETIREFHENVPRVEAKIDSLAIDLDTIALLHQESDTAFLATYHIWTLYNGSLQRITLAIGTDGKCSVVIDDTLAVGVGYFDPLNRGVTER